MPPRWVERLRDMTPQAQDRFLRNNQRFQDLPPDRQDQIRRRLGEWNRLRPEQRDRIRDNERIWDRMTPEQRQHIRQDVLPKWQQLPPERRQTIQRRLRVLRDMPEDARNRRLNDPDFMRGLTAEEQSMLRDLSHVHVGGAPEPPQPEGQF